MKERISLNAQGGDADRHVIPAYAGSKTIYGISRSLIIITNFLAEGKLRKKDYDFSKFSIEMETPKRGSFELTFLLNYPVESTIATVVAGGVAGNFAYDILKNCFKALTGQKTDVPERLTAALEKGNASFERLLEAVEPAARETHSLINNGVINININSRSSEENLLLNSETKEYIWGNVIDRNLRSKLFSVSRFDPNSRIGMVFDFEEKRPITFQLEKNVDERTVESIIWSQSEYTRKRILNKETDSAVAFLFSSLNAIDGRAKKIFPVRVRREIREL